MSVGEREMLHCRDFACGRWRIEAGRLSGTQRTLQKYRALPDIEPYLPSYEADGGDCGDYEEKYKNWCGIGMDMTAM